MTLSNPSETLVNVAKRLRQQATATPFKRAVVQPCRRDVHGRVSYAHLTFAQLDRESDRLAHGLVNIGIQRGTRTIMMVKPSIEFFALTFALFKTGAVPVVVDPGMGLRRMVACLRESQPQALIGIPPAHVLRLIFRYYFRSVDTFVTVGRKWFWGGYTLNALRHRTDRPFEIATTLAGETAAILFTTGSTGPAKGVVYTHGIFDAQVEHIRSHFQIDTDEIDLPTFPLFALFDPALGMTAVIPDMDPTQPAKADPRNIIEAICNHGVTNMFASPALLNRVGRFGKARGITLPSLKRVVSAGAPVSAENVERFASLLSPQAQVHTPYGATEAVPVISIASHEILTETKTYSAKGYGVCVGRPLDGIEVRIIGISDAPIERWSENLVLPQGEIGEIAVQGDIVTRHYYNRPKADALAKIVTAEGFWHRMGDVGWQDEHGRIWFCGRKSHRVITDQGTLYTIPCEAIFNTHPAVFRSALVGVGNAPKQHPVICIELEPEADAGKDRLRQELLDLAARNPLTQQIETILFHKSFPVDIRHNAKIFREKLALWAAPKVVSEKRWASQTP